VPDQERPARLNERPHPRRPRLRPAIAAHQHRIARGRIEEGVGVGHGDPGEGGGRHVGHQHDPVAPRLGRGGDGRQAGIESEDAEIHAGIVSEPGSPGQIARFRRCAARPRAGYRRGMRAEVIAIGDELVTGHRLDTNSRWLSAELAVLGIPVTFHTTAADTLEAGLEAFRIASGRAEIVVATGGLGPTADDLTRDVLAALADEPLALDRPSLEAIEGRFAARGAPCPESNRRQAMFPVGSRVIANPLGTAPGIDLTVPLAGRTSRIFALPGVPAEMRPMWQASVAPAVLAMLPEAATIVQRRIKCFGAGESAIEAMLPDLVRRGRDPLVGITAHEATITLRIAARGRGAEECNAKIAATEQLIRDCLGKLVYGVEDDELEDAALAAVAAAGGRLAIGEPAC